ncbi:hypothetical protein ElP_61350 [Tautonia plasticadhaerens]|uniref:Uncharacterized protein n=1 Tax=Tautonia plasticadhaerens TaxID=2527974 RepID=A0A518HBF2_9BACT|nr:hypothetical protein ElP_61350 [Tautonia plasticadhaerens]
MTRGEKRSVRPLAAQGFGPARGTGAGPLIECWPAGIAGRIGSVALRDQAPVRVARRYSRFMTLMFWVLIPFGQTASHSW